MVPARPQLGALFVTLATLGTSLAGQADSAQPGSPNLSGKWAITGPAISLTFLTLKQTGSQLRGEISKHGQCLSKDVKLTVTLEGDVNGRIVRLHVTDARLDGDFENPCTEYAVFVNSQIDFRGEVSVDGKKIEGPSDRAGSAMSTWTLSR